VAIVFMIGFALAFALGQRKPVTIAPPVAVNIAPVTVAEGAVVMANGLPNAGSGNTGGAGGGAGIGGRGGSSVGAAVSGGGRRGPSSSEAAGGG